MAQDDVEILVGPVDVIHFAEQRIGPAGEHVYKVVTEHISAEVEHESERESQSLLALRTVFREHVDRIAEQSDPFARSDLLIGVIGMDVALAGEYIRIEIRSHGPCAESVRILKQSLLVFRRYLVGIHIGAAVRQIHADARSAPVPGGGTLQLQKDQIGTVYVCQVLPRKGVDRDQRDKYGDDHKRRDQPCCDTFHTVFLLAVFSVKGPGRTADPAV